MVKFSGSQDKTKKDLNLEGRKRVGRKGVEGNERDNMRKHE